MPLLCLSPLWSYLRCRVTQQTLLPPPRRFVPFAFLSCEKTSALSSLVNPFLIAPTPAVPSSSRVNLRLPDLCVLGLYMNIFVCASNIAKNLTTLGFSFSPLVVTQTRVTLQARIPSSPSRFVPLLSREQFIFFSSFVDWRRIAPTLYPRCARSVCCNS